MNIRTLMTLMAVSIMMVSCGSKMIHVGYSEEYRAGAPVDLAGVHVSVDRVKDERKDKSKVGRHQPTFLYGRDLVTEKRPPELVREALVQYFRENGASVGDTMSVGAFAIEVVLHTFCSYGSVCLQIPWQ